MKAGQFNSLSFLFILFLLNNQLPTRVVFLDFCIDAPKTNWINSAMYGKESWEEQKKHLPVDLELCIQTWLSTEPSNTNRS